MSASSLIGQILNDRYQIDRLIGEGGMGAVYEAHHVLLPKRVAIKTLRAELSDDEKFRARFLREARATSRIEHPNIVGVSDVGVHQERLVYFVLEYLEGEDLSKTLEREYRLPWPRVQHIGVELCAALSAAHAAKVIHRDLKPSNCFRVATPDGDDRIKILDFGIAKLVEDTSGRRHADRLADVQTIDRRLVRLTETGEIFGTMAYMSPEHLRGEEVGYQTDIYAVGVILFELLTGRTPFLASNLVAFVHSLELDAPEPPSRYAPDMKIPADLDYKILKALQKRPQDRYASMLEFQRALESIHPDLPLPSPRSAAPAPSDADGEPGRHQAGPGVASRATFDLPLPSPRSVTPAPSDGDEPGRHQASPGVASSATFDADGPTRVLVRTPRGVPTVPARGRHIGRTVAALAAAAMAFGIGAWATRPAAPPDLDQVESDPLVAQAELPPARDGVAVEVPATSAVEPPPGVPSPQPVATLSDPLAAPAILEAVGPLPGRSPGRAKPRSPAVTKCDIDPYDRQRMFLPHRDAVLKRCRQDVPPHVQVLVQAQIDHGKLSVSAYPKLTGKLRAVSNCIAAYLQINVMVPDRFKACRTPPVPLRY